MVVANVFCENVVGITSGTAVSCIYLQRKLCLVSYSYRTYPYLEQLTLSQLIERFCLFIDKPSARPTLYGAQLFIYMYHIISSGFAMAPPPPSAAQRRRTMYS